MSITFPSEQLKPSILEGLPNQFVRPSFEELYGFDAITDALLTEAGEIIQTEDRETLQFDLNAAIPTTSTYNNTDSSVVLVLDHPTLDAAVSWTAFPTAVSYRGRFSLDGDPNQLSGQTFLSATSSPETASLSFSYGGEPTGTIVYFFLQAKDGVSGGGSVLKNYPRLSFTLP